MYVRARALFSHHHNTAFVVTHAYTHNFSSNSDDITTADRAHAGERGSSRSVTPSTAETQPRGSVRGGAVSQRRACWRQPGLGAAPSAADTSAARRGWGVGGVGSALVSRCDTARKMNWGTKTVTPTTTTTTTPPRLGPVSRVCSVTRGIGCELRKCRGVCHS